MPTSTTTVGDAAAQREKSHRMVTPNVAKLVFEFVNCELAEIIVLVGGAISPPVPFRRRCHSAAGATQY